MTLERSIGCALLHREDLRGILRLVRSASRAAFFSGCVLGLIGCAAISGLDQIHESPCVIDCDAGDDANDEPSADTGSGADSAQGSDTATSDGAGDAWNPGDASGNDARADAHGTDGAVEGDAGTRDAADASGDAGAPTDATTMDTSAPDSPPDVTMVDAPPEDSPEAATEAGCGPTNTVDNCGACGVACASAPSSSNNSASCNGATCSYQCLPSHLDCNGGTAPDTDGCECSTPGSITATCCGSACPTAHTTGFTSGPAQLDPTFYDCNTSINQQVALEACTQYSGIASNCATGAQAGSSCAGNELVVCNFYAPSTQDCVCWSYKGTAMGWAVDSMSKTNCICPSGSSGSGEAQYH